MMESNAIRCNAVAMTKPVIAIMPRLLDRFTPLLGNRFDIRAIGQEAGPARALVTSGGLGADAELIASLPELELIAVDGVGYDPVDLDAARARGVRVTNTPDVLTDDVADLAIGLMIAAFRGIVVGDRYVREGRWGRESALPLARRVSGRRLGLVGLGRIGSAIALRAGPMMASIAYSARRARPDMSYAFVPDLVALAEQSDVLIVTVPASAETAKLIDRRVIDALGPEGVLVNVARGSVVDEDALVQALVEGRLGAAGLDVFADEPCVPAALLDMDNVVLQPHRGSATRESRQAMAQLVIDNLDAHFAGRELLTAVI